MRQSAALFAVVICASALAACKSSGHAVMDGSAPETQRGDAGPPDSTPDRGDAVDAPPEGHADDAPDVRGDDASDAQVTDVNDAQVTDVSDAGGDTGQDLSAAETNPNRAVAIAAGVTHTCALLASGAVRCWGYNDFGQLGAGPPGPTTCVNGTATVLCSPKPVAVSNLSGATALSLGDYHSCAVLSGGAVKCWGNNSAGQLGRGNTEGPSACMAGTSTFPCATAPVTVPGLTGVKSLSASDEEHTCAALSDGSVTCWGLNGGQLGNGTKSGPSECPNGGGTLPCATMPVPVMNLAGATAVDTATFHSCAIIAGGAVSCWGGNLDGRLGNGTTTDSLVPVPVSNLVGATAIALGGQHSCALLSNGSVQCWGQDSYGTLGNTSMGPSTCALNAVAPPLELPCSPTPVPVSGLTGVTAIAAGGNHTCVLMGNGTVRCWGSNSNGQLGQGLGPDTCVVGLVPTAVPCATVPNLVPGLTGVTAIAAGAAHTCAVLSDGAVRCWGYNVFGQLGDGTTKDSAKPVAVTW